MKIKRKDYIKLYEEHEKPASTLFHKFFSKKIAKFLTLYFLRMGLTPNVMSLLTLILVLIAIFSLNFYKDSFGLVVFLVLLQLSYVLDCSDGVVARITNKSSKFGGFFDVTLDRLNIMLVFFGVGVFLGGQQEVRNEDIITFSISAIFYLNYQMIASSRSYHFPEMGGYMKTDNGVTSFGKKAVRIIYEFIDTGIFFFILSVSLFFNLTIAVVLFYGVIGFLLSLAMYLLLYRKN